jgi:hypothetical protein
LLEESEGKRRLTHLVLDGDNIKMDPKEIECDGMTLTVYIWVRIQTLQALVNTVINNRFP